MSTMSLEYKFMEKRPFFTAPFSFTYNQDSETMKTQSVDMVVDFTSNDIILGNKVTGTEANNFDWGLDCSAENDLCTAVSGEIQTGTYQGQFDYKYKTYNTVASLFGGVDLSSEKANMQIQMCELPKEFGIPFGKNGVFGMGPKSQFFTYLSNSNYNFFSSDNKQYFDYGLFVFTKDKTTKEQIQQGDKDGLFDFSDLYMKHWNDDKVNATIGINWAEADSTATTWQTTNMASFMRYDDGTDSKTATPLFDSSNRLCISPNFNGLIGVSQTDANQLSAKIGDLSKNPVISLRFDTSKDFDKANSNNLQIEFRENEYLVSQEGGNAKFTITMVDTSSEAAFIKSTGGCTPYKNQAQQLVYPYVLGRQFFQRNYVVFRAQLNDEQGQPIQNGKRYIGFSQYLPLDKITKSERNFLMIFGCVMVGLIIVALIMRVQKKGGDDNVADENDDYAKV